MVFAGGTPPAPHAGEISPLTEALRPHIRLPPKKCARARALRRRGVDIPLIAARLAAPLTQINLALAVLRTTNPAPSRATLNGTVEARDFVKREAEPGEACWQTLDRLLYELALRRAAAGARITKAL